VITVYAFKVGDEWRLAVGSRTGSYEVCLDKQDAKEKGEARLWREGGGTLKIFDNERPVGTVSVSVSQ
jgi:hypothetical protein